MKNLVFLVLLTYASFSAAVNCPEPCTCEGSKLDCSNKSLNMVLSGIFSQSNAASVDLSHNRIAGIQPEAFIHNKKLRSISLANNSNLRLPENTSLFHSDSVESMDLSCCGIKFLPKYLFSQTPNLRNLDLSGNELDDLPVEIFDSIPKLTHLNLTGNKLNKFNTELLRKLPSGIVLDVSGNNVSKLSDEDVKVLSMMPFVQMDKNPWNCDCNMVKAKSWCVANQSKLNVTCAEPPKFKGKSWDVLETSDCLIRPMSTRLLKTSEKITTRNKKENVIQSPYSIAIVGAFLAVCVGTIALSIIANRRREKKKSSQKNKDEVKKEEGNQSSENVI